MKNLEYKNWDAEEKKDEEDVSAKIQNITNFDEDDVIRGIKFVLLAKRKPSQLSALNALRSALMSEISQSSSELKIWKIRDLGLQATAAVIEAPNDKLQTLKDLTQNFPNYAAALSSRKISDNLRGNADRYYRFLAHDMLPRPGVLYVGALALNLGSPTFSMHKFLKTVRSELRAMDNIRAICSDYSQEKKKCNQLLEQLANNDAISRFGIGGEKEKGRNSQLEERQPRVDLLTGSKGVVTYVNNIEKDDQYTHWPRSLRNLLQPSWRLHAIARNLYTVILVVDIGNDICLEALETMQLMLDQGYPVRFGLVITSLFSAVDETEPQKNNPLDGMQASLLFSALRLARGPKTALDWLFRIVAKFSDSGKSPKLSQAINEFANVIVHSSEKKNEQTTGSVRTDRIQHAKDDAWELLSPTSMSTVRKESVEAVQETNNYVEIKGLCCSHFSFALNGRIVPGLNLRDELLPLLSAEQARLAELVASGFITDKTKSIYGKAIIGKDGSRDAIQTRFSLFLHTYFKRSDHTFLPDFTKNINYTVFNSLQQNNSQEALLFVAVSPSCITTMNNSIVVPLLSSEHVARVGLVLNTTNEDSEKCYLVINGLRVDTEGINEIDLGIILATEATVAEEISKELVPIMKTNQNKEMIATVRSFLGKRAQLLSSAEVHSLSQNPVQIIRQTLGKDTPLIVLDDDSTEQNSMIAVLDPLSEAAQRGVSVLLALRDVAKIQVGLVLVPSPQMSELPLKNYYRFALDDKEKEESQGGAIFKSLPPSHVLTLRLDTPPAWDAQIAEADQDLDNLRCLEAETKNCHDHVSFKINSLVLGGQCFDVVERRPPNGLQLELTNVLSSDAQVVSDTLVMQNLGYFQLRAPAPGMFRLRLAPNTRSAQLYELLDSSPSDFTLGDLNIPTSDSIQTMFTDMDGEIMQIRVRKRSEFKTVDLVEKLQVNDEIDDSTPAKETNGVLGRFFSSSSLNNKKNLDKSNPATSFKLQEQSSLEPIHVFSLATGALYERFLKIMMLSVRKRTSGPLHFWLFENYLTPNFKSAAAALVQYRNMSVHYVTYKWPEWLRRQTQKQRIIWGYKILFLDVLFPKHIPKVIYVDADQVVRSDLRDLWNLDLKGRPYGYTPFCDSRPDTLGFQFWRTGYWKDHLRGKPYHISALYVVDLQVFRRMAVGDQLRAVYDQLSRDPNSLANLDQDLPNYAQHSIPIFSLPQDWLWCESWCSDSSKSRARTIDLCNNPLHKENKLDMAKRIINGSLFVESWTELDREVRDIENAARESLRFST
uniref:UDP-glucose:glycoprotein glucosyltransferase n=1 Tax=Aureoumbra lagunensis TaxID=44058 RepID=A0A7S3JTS0_9STRA